MYFTIQRQFGDNCPVIGYLVVNDIVGMKFKSRGDQYPVEPVAKTRKGFQACLSGLVG